MKTIQLVENSKYVSLLAVGTVLKLKRKDNDSIITVSVNAIDEANPVKMYVVDLSTGTHYVFPAERFEKEYICLGIDLTEVKEEGDLIDDTMAAISDALKVLSDALSSYKEQILNVKIGEDKQVSDVVNDAENKIKDCVKQGKEYVQSGKAREDIAGTIEKGNEMISNALESLAGMIRKNNK